MRFRPGWIFGKVRAVKILIVCAAVIAAVACGKSEEEKAKRYKVVGISYCDDLGKFKKPLFLFYSVGDASDGGSLEGVGKLVFGRGNIVTDSKMYLAIVECPADAKITDIDFGGIAKDLASRPNPLVCRDQRILVSEALEARKSSDLRHEKYDGVIRWPKLEGVECATGNLTRDD